MAGNGLYYGPIGNSTLNQHVTQTPFGKVVTSGGIYDGRGREVSYNPIGGGWGITGSGSAVSGLIPTSVPSGGGGAVTAASPTQGGSAVSSYDSAINTLLGGVDSARAAAARSQARITNASADLDAARQAAGGIGSAITNINNAASGLAPYADLIRGNGDALSQLAASLMAGDAGAGGLAGDYLGAIRDAGDAALALSPERYVSRAASDVQASFGNAAGQLERELARRGVSAGSGAMSALRQQLQSAFATAVASAKTNAWAQGETEKLDALTKRANLYQGALSTAMEASGKSTETLAQAAGIVERQGSLFGTAGSLASAQTSAFADIGGVEVDFGRLELSNNEAVQNAIASVASAQMELAKFYADTMDETSSTTGYSVDSNGNRTYSNQTTTKSFR